VTIQLINETDFDQIVIHDVLGSEVGRFLNTGNNFVWDGLGVTGNKVPPGIYFVTLTGRGNAIARAKLIRSSGKP
jgi:hypothetical protein